MPVATNAQLIGGLYAAVFNRAPDPSGLTFWENAFTGTSTIYDLAEGFAAHPVFASTYGGLTNAQFVATIYQQVLGAGGDADGLAYWTAKADAGISRADIVAEFVNDSLTVDLSLFTNLTPAELAVAQDRQAALTNKVDVGLTFAAQFGANANLNPATDTSTQAGLESDPAYLAAQAAIANVTASPASVTTAKANITAALATANPTGTLIGATPPVVVDPGTPTTPTPTPTTFIATTDSSGKVTFTGTATGDIAVAWSGTPNLSLATFTRDGKTATADFSGAAHSIALGSTAVLKATAAQLAGVDITGAGAVKLTDTTLAAVTLASLNATVLADLDIASVGTVTGLATDVNNALFATGITGVGAQAVTLSDDASNVTAALLSSIGGGTTGTVTLAGSVTITGTSSQLTAALVTADTLVVASNAGVVITDAVNANIAATVISAIDAKASGPVLILNALNITGTLTELNAALVAGGTSVAAGASEIHVTDVSGDLSVVALNDLAQKTSGNVSVTGAGTGTGDDALNVTGSLADLTNVLLDGTPRVSVGAADIDITDATGNVAATLLSQLASKTSNEVWVLNKMNVTGTVAEITAALVTSSKVVLDLDSKPTVTLSETTASAGALNLINDKTPGVLFATSLTEVTGSVADLLTYTSKPSGEIEHAANYAIVSTGSTITAAQLDTLDDANGTGAVSTSAGDGWSITGLSGSIIEATASVDKFVFSAADVGVRISEFSAADDTIDVSMVSPASGFTLVTGPLTTDANKIYFLSAGAGTADTAAASATALTAAATWTGANATAYIVISDDDSSAIYKFTDTASPANGVDVTELTLLGAVDSVLTSGNFAFSAS